MRIRPFLWTLIALGLALASTAVLARRAEKARVDSPNSPSSPPSQKSPTSPTSQGTPNAPSSQDSPNARSAEQAKTTPTGQPRESSPPRPTGESPDPASQEPTRPGRPDPTLEPSASTPSAPAPSTLAARSNLSPDAEVRLCQENLKKIATALEMYATDHSGDFPGDLSAVGRQYIDAIPHCPAGQQDTYSSGYQPRSIYTDLPDSYTLHCHGHHHARAKLPADLPSIDPRYGLKPQLPFLGTPAQALEKCRSNLKNIGTALEMYGTDNQGRYPGSLDGLTPNYLGTIPPCPVSNKDTYSSTYRQGRSAPGNNQDYRDYYFCACSGDHGTAGPAPEYDSIRGLRQER